MLVFRRHVAINSFIWLAFFLSFLGFFMLSFVMSLFAKKRLIFT